MVSSKKITTKGYFLFDNHRVILSLTTNHEKMRNVKLTFLFVCLGLLSTSCNKQLRETSLEGRWRHDETGFEVSILGIETNSGDGGKGFVMATGTAFPEGAMGGLCIKNIELQEKGVWTGIYRTYFPSTGWQDSYEVSMFMEEPDEFTLGGEVYRKI